MMKQNPIDADTIDLVEVAGNVRRGWRFILGGLIAGAAMAAAVIYFVPARFSAASSLVARAQESSTGSIVSRLAGSIPGGAGGLLPGGITSSPIETEVQVLSSRALAGEAVDSLRLQLRIRAAQRQAPSEIFAAAAFPGSFRRHRVHVEKTAGGYSLSDGTSTVQATPGTPVKIGGGTLTLSANRIPASFDVDVYDREEAITRFQKRFSVTKPGGEVIAVGYQADDSLTAAAVPNLIVRRYLARRHTTDRGINQRRVDFLTLQVDSVEGSLRAAEEALRRDQEASGVVDPVVVGKLELERAGELRKETGTLDVERGALSQLLAQLANGTLNPRQLAAFPTFLRSPGINDLLGQLSTLETKRLQQLATLTPEDPSVIATTDAIKNVEAQLPPLARAYEQSLDRQRSDVGRQLDTLRSSIEKLPAQSESALRDQREVLRLGQTDAVLRGQLVDAKLSAIGEGGDVRLLDVAEPPRKVSFPAPGMTMGVGLGGGLMIGLILAALSGYFGRYVNDVRSIERHIGVPAIALDPAMPFILAGSHDARTLLLVPLDAAADTSGVAERLMRTAVSRGLRGTVVDLTNNGHLPSAAPDLDRLGSEFDLVVVRLPELAADATVGALRESRPVLFVASAGRIDRRLLSSAVENLERLSIPCAGVVLSRGRAPGLLRG